MPNRTRSYYREAREKSIARKYRISHDYWYVKHPGMLSKGKIHCSCWMCATKTKKDEPPISEQRKYRPLS